MKFAYADPPYLGYGSFYAELHPEALDWFASPRQTKERKMAKISEVARAVVNRERVRNIKAICLQCRNGDPVEYVKEPVSNIGYWAHGSTPCEAGPIRDRAMQYGTSRVRA